MEFLNKKNKTLTLVTGIKEVKDEEGKVEQKLVTEDYAYPIFTKGSLVKKAVDLGVQMDKDYEAGDFDSSFIDRLADFTVELYGKKFKRDKLIDGIDAPKLIDTLVSVLYIVLDGEQDDVEQENFIKEKTR